MAISLNTVNALEAAIDRKIANAAQKRTRTQGTVTRIGNDGTVYATVTGSSVETPLSYVAASVKPGDVIPVTIQGGKAYGDGNYTDPSAGVQYVGKVEQRADSAIAEAERARYAADSAEKDAERAWVAANSAEDAATTAWNHADEAYDAAVSAQTSAGNANTYANAALGQLSVVQDVMGVITWASEHGSFVLTQDSTVQAGKVYFTYDSQTGDYVPVVAPSDEYLSTYYELTVDEAMDSFIMAHLAVTASGLWVLPSGFTYALTTDTSVVSGRTYFTRSGTDPDYYYTVVTNPSGNPSQQGYYIYEAQYSDGYKMLLSSNGAYIYDSFGVLVMTYGENIVPSTNRAFYIGDPNSTSYILFTPASGNTPAKITIGGDVQIGSDKTLSELLSELEQKAARGTGILPITTAPTSYTTAQGGFTPSYRISLATVKTQAGVTEVLVGDELRYSSDLYPVGYVSSSYVYTGDKVSIQGDAGTDGGRWYTGTGITGTSTTATVFSGSGVTYAVVGDMYLNTSTYNTYRCTLGGNASTAKWVYEANIKGGQGAAGLNQATVYLYKRAASASKPSSGSWTYTFATGQLSSVPSGWSQSFPAETQGDTTPVWMMCAVASSNTATDTIDYSEWTTPVKMVSSGSNGQGVNCAAVILCKRGSTAPAKPNGNVTYTFATGAVSGSTNGWTIAMPSGTDPLWAIAASASSTGTTDTIASTEWSDQVKVLENGTDGLNQATICLYRRSASSPSLPTSSVTYTFATGALSSVPTNWSRNIPTADGNPCWVTMAVAISTEATDTIAASEWVTPTKMAEDGEDGYNHAVVTLYQRASSTPSKPSGTVTYTFSTGQLSSVPSGWSTTIPSGSNPCYVTQVACVSQSDTYSIASSAWSSPVILAENGADAVNYFLSVSPGAIVRDSSGTLGATSISWSATSKQGAGTPAAYSGYVWSHYTTDYSTWNQISKASSAASSDTVTIPSSPATVRPNVKAVRITLHTASPTSSNQVDSVTVPVVDSVKGDAGPGSAVYITFDAVDWIAGTATLRATLLVDGTVTTPTTYKWTKGSSTTSLGTSATLSVSDVQAVYNCTVTWSGGTQVGKIDLVPLAYAAAVAGNYIVSTASNDVWIHSDGHGPASDGTVTNDTFGWRIGSVFELVRAGITYLKAWRDEVAQKMKFAIGDMLSGNYAVMDDDSFNILHATTVNGVTTTTEIAHFGYGDGNAVSGTAARPYYTLGGRLAATDAYDEESTYSVGDIVLYDGVEYVCVEEISIAEDWDPTHWVVSVGNWSVAEGYDNIASGYASHAEGLNTTALYTSAHAEGYQTKALGYTSHAEGSNSRAVGQSSHAEGASTVASGYYSHAEGLRTVASGHASHAQNAYTTAGYDSQTAIGKYNYNKQGNLFEIGYGSENSPKNVFEVSTTGDVTIAGSHYLPYGTQIWDNSNGNCHMLLPEIGTAQAEYSFEGGGLYVRKRTRTSSTATWGSWGSWTLIS